MGTFDPSKQELTRSKSTDIRHPERSPRRIKAPFRIGLLCLGSSDQFRALRARFPGPFSLSVYACPPFNTSASSAAKSLISYLGTSEHKHIACSSMLWETSILHPTLPQVVPISLEADACNRPGRRCSTPIYPKPYTRARTPKFSRNSKLFLVFPKQPKPKVPVKPSLIARSLAVVTPPSCAYIRRMPCLLGDAGDWEHV